MHDIFSKKLVDPMSISAVRISLASPQKILEWSHGEVKKSGTISARTLKPVRDGLFCAKIFGPRNDHVCNCGRLRPVHHRGLLCEKCGVEVTLSEVRRERLGHINLAASDSEIIGRFLVSTPPILLG